VRRTVSNVLSGLAVGYGGVSFIYSCSALTDLRRVVAAGGYDLDYVAAEAAVIGLYFIKVAICVLWLIAAQLIRLDATPAASGE